jgi:glutamine amidotransferase
MIPRIALLDYGMGNLHSVSKALEHVGAKVDWIREAGNFDDYHGMILPGVGHYGDGIRQLNERGFTECITEWTATDRPFLGICLGLQMLFEESDEEPGLPGIGIFPGRVRIFEASQTLRVPQMGWNRVHAHKECPLFQDIPQDSYFYFVHSFYADPSDPSVMGGSTEYGVEYCSFAWKNNTYASQFHPEKSQVMGLKMLTNFVNLLP